MKFNQPKAIYMQIADFICESILAEELKAGDKVQSVREMAATVQVNPNTVTRTFNYLKGKGILNNKRGVGNFVTDEAFDKVRHLKKELFLNEYLPEVFKMMDLLHISMEDIEAFYKENEKSK